MPTSGPVTPVDGVPTVPAGRQGPGLPVVLLSLLLAAVLGAGSGVLLGRLGGAADTPVVTITDEPTQEPVAIEPVSVTSYDPVGGSGFQDEGDGAWSTQTYTTADFGRLKPGVGLLVDLGEAREVGTVTFESASAGVSVALLAGDAPPSGAAEGMTPVAETTTVEGTNELSAADAGAHRYWMLWVTSLAQRGDGYGADVTTPVLTTP